MTAGDCWREWSREWRAGERLRTLSTLVNCCPVTSERRATSRVRRSNQPSCRLTTGVLISPKEARAWDGLGETTGRERPEAKGSQGANLTPMALIQCGSWLQSGEFLANCATWSPGSGGDWTARALACWSTNFLLSGCPMSGP